MVLVIFHTLPVGRSGSYFILFFTQLGEEKYRVWARSAHEKSVNDGQNHHFGFQLLVSVLRLFFSGQWPVHSISQKNLKKIGFGRGNFSVRATTRLISNVMIY